MKAKAQIGGLMSEALAELSTKKKLKKKIERSREEQTDVRRLEESRFDG